MSIIEAKERIVNLHNPISIPDSLLSKTRLVGRVLVAPTPVGEFKAILYTIDKHQNPQKPRQRAIFENDSNHISFLVKGEQFALSLSAELSDSGLHYLKEGPQPAHPLHEHKYFLAALARLDNQPLATAVTENCLTHTSSEKLLEFELEHEPSVKAYCDITEFHTENLQKRVQLAGPLEFQPTEESGEQQLQVIILRATEKTIYRKRFSPKNSTLSKFMEDLDMEVDRRFTETDPIAAFSIRLACL